MAPERGLSQRNDFPSPLLQQLTQPDSISPHEHRVSRALIC